MSQSFRRYIKHLTKLAIESKDPTRRNDARRALGAITLALVWKGAPR